MLPQEIRKFVVREPFMPFRLHVSDGRSYDVTDPRGLFVTLMHVEVGVGWDDEAGLYRRSDSISPEHVTRIDPLTDETR